MRKKKRFGLLNDIIRYPSLYNIPVSHEGSTRDFSFRAASFAFTIAILASFLSISEVLLSLTQQGTSSWLSILTEGKENNHSTQRYH